VTVPDDDARPEPMRLGFTALDRQIYDADGRSVGKVDDIELSWDGTAARPVVTALLTGGAALGPRIAGRPGRLWAALLRRLRPDAPGPVRLPIGGVAAFRPAVRLSSPAPAEVWAVEDWLRDHVIGRVPGAGRADDDGR
jgi:hypothetical protein